MKTARFLRLRTGATRDLKSDIHAAATDEGDASIGQYGSVSALGLRIFSSRLSPDGKANTLPMKTVFFTTLIAATAIADHGPGTSGSGFNTQTAETLKAREWDASFNFDWTEFDSPSPSALIGKEHFDLIDRSFLSTFSVSFGATENLQLGLAFGYYAAEGTRRIAHHEEEAEAGHHEHAEEHHEETAPSLASFEPDGWTDLWLTGKYRVHRGPAGSFALLGGVKFPVGETRVLDSDGERLEPASTPGSGAWDGMAGAAYTFALTPSLALDASAQYTLRGEKRGYRLGNRLDAGVALGWRIFGEAKSFPQVSLQAEANVRAIGKSDTEEGRDGNTGGTVLFLSPGARVRFTEHAAWSVGVQLPVVQDLNGDQVETAFRVTSGFSFTF